MPKTKTRKQSPIADRDKPLRTPGQYLVEERERFLDNHVLPLAMLPVVATIWAAVEWWRYLVPSPPNPLFATGLAVCTGIYTAVRLPPLIRRSRALSQGLEGEKVVGQALEQLRADGWQIFHDVPGDGFNLDHVVISRRGVWVIETKTLSKPAGENGKITFDGEQLRVAGYPADQYLTQAVSQSRWLRQLLESETGKRFPVKSILVFPGWWVENADLAYRGDTSVLPLKLIPIYLERQPEVLLRSDETLAGCQLAQYVRRSAD